MEPDKTAKVRLVMKVVKEDKHIVLYPEGGSLEEGDHYYAKQYANLRDIKTEKEYAKVIRGVQYHKELPKYA